MSAKLVTFFYPSKHLGFFLQLESVHKDNSSYNPISTVAAMIRSIVFSPYRKENYARLLSGVLRKVALNIDNLPVVNLILHLN